MDHFKIVAQNFKIMDETKHEPKTGTLAHKKKNFALNMIVVFILFTFNGWTKDAQLSHLRNNLTVEICSTVHVVKG